MSAYLRKEIRLLLPSFGIAAALALGIWLIPTHESQTNGLRMVLVILPLVFCPVLVVMTALDSFGREIGGNTFSHLLAQPVPRANIWWTKSLLLAVAMLLVFGIWWLSFLLHLPEYIARTPGEIQETFVATCLIVLTAYSGGMCSVLLLRQVGGAFWFTLLVPGVLATSTYYVTERFGGVNPGRNVSIVLIVYSVVAFVGAWRLFLRAQDVSWTGGEIALPGWLRLPRALVPSVRSAGRRQQLALIIKELQLQQSQFVIAGVLVLLHGAMIVARKMFGGFKESWAMELLAYQFWALWLAMPVLVGCAAVAEERRLGTLEGQLCLPSRRRRQFATKFGVAILLAVLFGVVVPCAFEGERILPSVSRFIEQHQLVAGDSDPIHIALAGLVDRLGLFQPLLRFIPQVTFALAFVIIAFYASTLTRNTLQSIGPAIFGIIVTWALLFGAMFIEVLVRYPLWQGGLIYLVGVPVLIVMLVSLAYWNFKHVLVGWPVWRRNFVVFFVVMAGVMALTTAIYQRSWELLTSLEPQAGPVQIAGAEPVHVQTQGWHASYYLPDGRVWSSRRLYRQPTLAQAVMGDWDLKKTFPDGRFMDGTNWTCVAMQPRDVLALKGDGTLWVSEAPDTNAWALNDALHLPSAALKLVPYGNDSDWKELVGHWNLSFALKSDGTLWAIGTNRFNSKTWPGLRAFEPRRLGTDSDWAEVYSAGERMIFRKRDGTTYIFPQLSSPSGELLQLEEGVSIERIVADGYESWKTLGHVFNRQQGYFQIAVTPGGRLVVATRFQVRSGNRGELVVVNKPIGTGTNWMGLAANGNPPVTLKADGTLWLWDFNIPASAADGDSPVPERLGNRSDWRSVFADGSGGVFSLAADGRIWFWHLKNRRNAQDFFPLLRPKRKPQLVGDIFAGVE